MADPHNTTNDISYAKKYCKTYNSAYISYKGNGRDCANFVCQCLKAGGLDLSECGNKDNKEMIINCVYLRSCHQKKGQKYQKGKPNSFKSGYPFFKEVQHAMFAILVSGNNITYCAQTTDT